MSYHQTQMADVHTALFILDLVSVYMDVFTHALDVTLPCVLRNKNLSEMQRLAKQMFVDRI